jgi:site-specific DNA-cytosine methylase
MMELFAGGGGLSYLAQEGEEVAVRLCWANDNNPNMAATYTANHPEVFVSVCLLLLWLRV